ncbi:rRNA-processing protein UTP21 [Aspergillus saccharolyticus JOP 1030-1]|uniref:SnoRNA binding protein n=1 Tax=Aspergillus saccharolyticus JOP 1030-1 TaxID=1450539 RepID=A0A318ZXV2_9EURO|nr:snoRNA binding protein [Aspergillus saccharolyticus JOP 1030-1]PYH40232.1 snoRNA binding protein [Aspergillus saccharolyticus JOP 1030-1]
MSKTKDDDFDLPSAKRQKRVTSLQSQQHVQSPGSKIFSPYRTLGLVTTKIPLTYVRLGKSTYQITTSVGRSLQTYDLRRGLSLVFVSRPQTPDIITATFAWQDRVFAAWGNVRPGSPGGIWVFKRGAKVASLQLPSELTEPIDRLLVFGSWVIGINSRCISVWKNASYQHHITLFPQHTKDLSTEQVYTGQICNMPTYLNKIFAGRCDGKVDIWNVKSGKLIHTILPASSSAGAVTALQATPALSMIAIAYKSGQVSVCDVQTGQVVLSLRSKSSRLPVITSLTFRTDGLGAGEDGRAPGVMASACLESGDITLWDLNNGGRISGVLRQAHGISGNDPSSGVSHVQFLEGQPVLISSGGDNSLKTWIFDHNPFSSVPRLLHFRSGHSAPITAVEFLPAASDGSELAGKWLLSASKDRSFWSFSARKDSQNAEISQGAVEHKTKKKTASNTTRDFPTGVSEHEFRAAEITCIACSLNRDGGMGTTTSGPIWANPKISRTDESSKTGWESIVTGHRGDKYARTWFWGRKRAGRWALETGDGSEVKSVAISKCGTFAVIGSAGGSINMFNLQSGAHRQSFPVQDLSGKSKDKLAASHVRSGMSLKHSKAVTGLVIDSLNRYVVSCGLDGKVKFWDLVLGSLVDELDWYPMTAINGLRYSRTNELVALGCDDLSIRIVDVETRKVIREFWGCVGQINDFSFSNDGRWIIAASMDSTIRVWDLPTGHLIDVFHVSSTCTSVAMSSTGEFLATAHADGLGITLWSNRSLFVPISTQSVDDRRIGSVGIPASSIEFGSGVIDAAFCEEKEQVEGDGPLPTVDQLSGNMVTLSVVPKSKWQTFLHLNLIKERNKPKEAPKAPVKAPFFLPSHFESSTAATDTTRKSEVTVAERSRISKIQRSGESGITSSKFTNLLQAGHVSNDFDPFIEHLKSLAPAKADLEIRSLGPQRQAGRSELSIFVVALTYRLNQRRDFELVNAWMAVFLRVHADSVADCSKSDGDDGDDSDPLRRALLVWSRAQRREAQRLAELVGYCRGVVGFMRSTR